MDSLAQLAPMLSSNSSSSSSSRSTGGEWTGELYFYPDMDDDNKDVSEHVVTKDELFHFVEQNKETNKIEKMGKETRLEKLLPTFKPGKCCQTKHLQIESQLEMAGEIRRHGRRAYIKSKNKQIIKNHL
jgi:hypothetical protein